jgi:hypothetical protein
MQLKKEGTELVKAISLLTNKEHVSECNKGSSDNAQNDRDHTLALAESECSSTERGNCSSVEALVDQIKGLTTGRKERNMAQARRCVYLSLSGLENKLTSVRVLNASRIGWRWPQGGF